MATPANEGGTGGPFRRRPFRRAETPYDRPPAALRGVRGVRRVAEGGRWISKIVDPASRLISRGASKLFSLMFTKRLTAPPSISEEDHQSREDISHIADTIPSSQNHSGESQSQIQNNESQSQIQNYESPSQIQNDESPSQVQNGRRDVENKTNSSGRSGVAELEQLLEHKTFTRVEYDRLTELLHSRMVEASNSAHEVNNEKKEKASVPAQKVEIVSSRVHIPKDEAASPAELAKAYMGSQLFKASSIGSQVLQEDANLPSIPSTSKRLDISVAPRSVIRFCGISEQPERGYWTAKPPGRSAIYRMSRSPYFKAGDLSRDCYSSPSSSPIAMKSRGKQVVKRGRAALDGDFGSFGPIRRIRQKSNWMSPSKGPPRSTLSENFLSSPSIPLFKNVSEGSMSVQKPLMLDEQNYDRTGLKAAENGILRPTMLLSQSSETAKKLFQQLDKLVPSPKEKSSELKTIAQPESPSKLTLDILHGRSKMENLISSKSFTASHLPNTGSSLSQKLDMVKENGPLKYVCLGGKPSSEANGVSKPSKDGQLGLTSECIAVASSVEVSVPKRPSFQMSAPDDSLELDDDYERKKSSIPLTTGKDDADTKMSKQINVISETAILGNPPKTSSQSMPPVSTSISSPRKADKKALPLIVTGKNNGFAFPVVSDLCTQFQPPPTPTMPSPQQDRPDVQKEQTSPIFSFGSKDNNSSTFSLTNFCVNGSAAIKVGEGSRSEPKLSTSSVTTTSAEGSAVDKKETENAGALLISSGNTFSSGLPALSKPLFGFDTSSCLSINNDSLNSSSTISPVSGSAAIALSESPQRSISINNTATASSSSSLCVSSSAATFSTVPSFQFGAGGSMSSPFSLSQSLNKSNSSVLEANSVKGSQFGISSSTSQGTSAVFPPTGSSSSHVSTPVSIVSSCGSSPALSTSAMSSSSFANSSLFSSTSGISSPIAVSSALPSTVSSAFGFNASTQSSGLSTSFANSSSQNSATTVFGAAGGSTSSGPLFGTSQNSTVSTVTFTGGSIFDAQSTQSPQSSISQFGSNSLSPSFGLENSSSSSGFGTSPLVPATPVVNPFTSSSGFSCPSGFGNSSANSSSSFAPATVSLFISTTSSNTSSSTAFSFGLSASGSSTSPFIFSPSSGSGFPFTSAGTTTSSTPSLVPTFGVPNPTTGFSSTSPEDDQMNEDSMTDDTTQAATPLAPTFGQLTNPPPAQPFVFGSPAVQPGAPVPFQFGGQQSSLPQTPSPFQATGSLEFNAGGSFSLGSGGGDKSGRRFVKAKRDKRRK